MPDFRDLLPPPPWEGPPVPKIFQRHYGPWEDAPQIMLDIWQQVLKEEETRFPTGHPQLVAEAKRAGLSQEETRLQIAHERWLDRKRAIVQKWEEEERIKGEPEEEE